MNLILTQTPFSRFGSFLSIFQPKGDPGCGPGLYLRVHHAARVGRRDVIRLELLVAGKPIKFTTSATASVLTLAAGKRRVQICFDGDDTLRVTGQGAGLRLRAIPGPGNVAQPLSPHRWSVNARQSYCRFLVEALTGDLRATCPWEPKGTPPMTLDLLPGPAGQLDAAIDRYWSSWVERTRRPFSDCVRDVEREWSTWLARQPTASPSLRKAGELAAYINWASAIRPAGLIKRPALLMSKVQMDNVWSWDHCFNAMALVQHAPELAFDQWLLPFDQQDEFGALPDAFNPVAQHFNFCKPPVHGWALQFMIPRLTQHQFRQAYAPLAAWTNWWLTHRRLPAQTLPYYLHGNDSGWDNSTMFDAGAPLVAPDLAAFLVIQCEVLAELAAKPREKQHWQNQSRQLLDALLAELWKGDRFVARRLSDGFEVKCDSLVPLMPIVLGNRLPKGVSQPLTIGLRRHLTKWGLATELTGSPHYTSDGYWRGPIWAPCTLIAVDGLVQLRESKLARDISQRFCRLCAKSGFAENFDALTGAALRDTAYTWTSSVFLLLAHATRR